MKPILKIGDNDFTDWVEELTPTQNDLDADGSGRDVQTGLMYRTKIATKITWTVKFLDLPEAVAKAIRGALNSPYYTATLLDPDTNTQTTKTYYTSAVSYGAQVYKKSKKQTVYSGMSFNMIER